MERTEMEDGNQRTAQELSQERMFLDVLCRDYTSVYYLNLNEDEVEVLKIASTANAVHVVGTQLRQKRRYSEEMKKYCESYVADSDKSGFLAALGGAAIRAKLETAKRFVYRYQSDRNRAGHQYFEAQVVRISEEQFDGTAILAFRHMDDVITAEEQHRQELASALQKEMLSNEVLVAISKIYYAIYRIDLTEDTYEEIFSDSRVEHLQEKTGCASNDMMQLCQAFVVPEYQGRMRQFFDIATLSRRLRNEDTIAEEYLAKDGNWHTARFITKRRGVNGEVTHALYVARLISDAKRREQNWIAIAEEANKANQAKTDFLRHMSHDIRTPLNGIYGMIEIADRHRGDVEKLQECRRKTLSAMDYLLSLVNNVLDIGKLETGELELEHRPFDLVTLLQKQLPIVETQATENGLIYRGGKEYSTIRHRYLMGSPVHLNRVLMNISNNAIKYNRRGGSVLVYCTELSSDDTTAVYQFVCSDTGIGMSQEFQKRAFEPFTQEGREAVTSYNGSGLGLSIVKEMVARMNGTIDLQSEEGVGTTFTVTIPFEIDGTIHESGEKAEQTPVDVKGWHALLAEDNELNREIAQILLEDEGLIVTPVGNGAEAVQKFADSRPGEYDFIFMDIMMPVMNGLKAAKMIRGLDREDARTVPILAMTANAFSDDIRQSIEAGMNLHLMKPLDAEKLHQSIQTLALERGQGKEG
ncbi:MAG: ATP-binding protein [Lachnospiraceae bacterium]|nr:ATP-binding protein [Lachnospiraceae bacterium]